MMIFLSRVLVEKSVATIMPIIQKVVGMVFTVRERIAIYRRRQLELLSEMVRVEVIEIY